MIILYYQVHKSSITSMINPFEYETSSQYLNEMYSSFLHKSLKQKHPKDSMKAFEKEIKNPTIF